MRRFLPALALLASLALGACGGTASPPKPAASTAGAPSGAAAAQPESLKALIAAANKEGVVNYADINGPELLGELNKRFNQRFGTNIKVNLVPLRATQTETRLRSEIAAHKITLDAVHQNSSLVFSLMDNKVDAFEKFDWLGTFGSTLPELKTMRVPAGSEGYVLEYQHLVAAIAYNTKLVQPQDVPKKWEDLLDPKWKGKKLVINPQGSSTYQHIARWDANKVYDFSMKLAAQEPLWVGSSPNIANAVAKGEALIGVPDMNSVLDINKTEPIALAPVEFYPGIQQLMYTVKGSPNIDAARLWAAWMSTEGMHVSAELDHHQERAWPDSNTDMSKAIATMGGELAMLDTRDKLNQAADVRDKIVAAYRKLGAK